MATKNQFAAHHVRRLRTIRSQLLEMSAQWDDVDQFCMGALEDLADQAEDVATNLRETKDGGAA
jgi:hypothetical protein